MGRRDSSRCADCGRNLLTGGYQIVRRATGKHVFICDRCADERYGDGAGQESGC